MTVTICCFAINKHSKKKQKNIPTFLYSTISDSDIDDQYVQMVQSSLLSIKIPAVCMYEPGLFCWKKQQAIWSIHKH